MVILLENVIWCDVWMLFYSKVKATGADWRAKLVVVSFLPELERILTQYIRTHKLQTPH